MAKKKRKPEDESPKPSRPSKNPGAKPRPGRRSGSPAAPLGGIDALVKQLLGAGEDPVRARAEELLHRAFQADDPAEIASTCSRRIVSSLPSGWRSVRLDGVSEAIRPVKTRPSRVATVYDANPGVIS